MEGAYKERNTPQSALRAASALRCPKNAAHLRLLAFFDRCGNSGFASPATGSAKPQFPLDRGAYKERMIEMNRKYRKTIIAGNWKMNQLASTIKPFMEELKANMPKTRTCDVVLCAPAVMVPALIRAGKDCKVAVGAQDVSKYEKGAYTGEISAAQLSDIGAKYCIVGHSERRQYHGEDDMLVNAKAKALLAKGIAPIICVGESLEQREMDLTMEYVAYQVKAALSGIDATQLRGCIIAYEPIWAIGTGKTATAEQAQEVCEGIRAVIRKIYGARPARAVSILYGGSMNAKNAAELLAQPDIDGGLIGGASLKPVDFATIIAATAQG